MAFTAANYDNCKRLLHFRINMQNVPVPLPFDLITIDNTDQYYEPVKERIAANARKQPGQAAGAVYVTRNTGLPLPEGGGMSVWEWYGV